MTVVDVMAVAGAVLVLVYTQPLMTLATLDEPGVDDPSSHSLAARSSPWLHLGSVYLGLWLGSGQRDTAWAGHAPGGSLGLCPKPERELMYKHR